ncbi:MAG: hypothetical protein ACI4LE_03830 [Faecalibacterium sp.]
MKHSGYFPLERNRYYYGKLLTVRDFEREQDYFRSKQELSNRMLHGAGVVCGMGVTVSDDTTLLIESGMALDYHGREMVLEEPLVRKLQMLEGYEELKKDRLDAYLCLAYREEEIQPVNAVGVDIESSHQYNVTRESCRLYLSSEAPPYRQILECRGEQNINVLFADEELTLLLTAPSTACAGSEFTVRVLIVKNHSVPPIRFTLEGESNLVQTENGRLRLEYAQSPEEKKNVIWTSFRVQAQELSDLQSQLFPVEAELDLEVGSRRYKHYLKLDAPVRLCASREGVDAVLRREDTLARHLAGAELPIYLAKLELIRSSGGVFLSSATSLPFEQSIRAEHPAETASHPEMEVKTTVRSLEYWQKPEVQARYHAATDTLSLDFGIPSPEQYDYSMSHGVVELEMSGGIRVNNRYFSQEIPHGLGQGAVDVRLSVEFPSRAGETLLLVGNSEVFKSKAVEETPPWVEAAAIVYPERGTMKIGVWLHDTVSGSRLRVHYFAQKPEHDTSRLMGQDRVTIQIRPEITRMKKRESFQFRAEVNGSADKAVRWEVRDENGGEIDRNGIYHAPETPGTYEVTASARADENARASAFVIVE